MNKVILTGRLSEDPITRYSKHELPVTTFRLAVNRKINKGEETKADFITCVAFSRLAKVCLDYLSKGRLVALEGKLRYTKQSKFKSKTEVIVDSLQMLDGKFYKGDK